MYFLQSYIWAEHFCWLLPLLIRSSRSAQPSSVILDWNEDLDCVGLQALMSESLQSRSKQTYGLSRSWQQTAAVSAVFKNLTPLCCILNRNLHSILGPEDGSTAWSEIWSQLVYTADKNDTYLTNCGGVVGVFLFNWPHCLLRYHNNTDVSH